MGLSRRSKVTISSSVFLVLMTFVFFNAAQVHEFPYDPQEAIPLSSLLSESPFMEQENITIPAGQVAYIDSSMDFGKLTIDGELHCDQARAASNIELKVNAIEVKGVFQCGRSSARYLKKLTISLKHSNYDPQTNPFYRGIIVNGGHLIFNGGTKRSEWFRLKRTAQVGDNFIELDRPSKRGRAAQKGNPWRVGDEIAIGPTSFYYAEAEAFTITHIDEQNPDKYYLDGTIQHQHWGEKQVISSQAMGNITLDERAEVANLTRTITVQADESAFTIPNHGQGAFSELGGHIMTHANAFASLDGVELRRMGQAGVMARYPFHWHLAGDVPGQFIKNSSIHRSFQRCVTVHRTNFALVKDNVCFDFKGHGFFLEDGTEVHNTLTGNLAIMARLPHPSRALLVSDINQNGMGTASGRFHATASFWISNPNNTITHNVASGSVGTGFWMSFEKRVYNLSGTEVVAEPIKENTKLFEYNIAHASRVGMTWDGAPNGENAGNPNNPNDRLLTVAHYDPENPPTFRNLRVFKNSMTGIYFRSQTNRIKHLVAADNGWSVWNGYNQIVEDSVIIGKTNNNRPEMYEWLFQHTSRRNRGGVILYDGPFEVHNTDFVNFSTEPETYIRPSDGREYDVSYVPFFSIGGARKLTNYTSGLRFDPEPVYRTYLRGPENKYFRNLLGSNSIRDLDGSLTGRAPGTVVTGNRSLGVVPNGGCEAAPSEFKNYKICLPHFKETFFVMRKFKGPGQVFNLNSYVVRRSDGRTSYPRSEWQDLHNEINLQFTMPNSNEYSFEILPELDYMQDLVLNNGDPVHLEIAVNSEIPNPTIPIVRILAYGNNCSLGQGAIRVNNLQQLESANITSYYSHGEDFYIKVFPNGLFQRIDLNANGLARAYDVKPRLKVTCDNTPIPNRVTGRIDTVTYGQNYTVISGWACNYKSSRSIRVQLYAHGGGGRSTAPHYIGQVQSNRASEEAISFKCGSLDSAGRRFRFSVPNSILAQYPGKRIYVKGISNTGGPNEFLNRSGTFWTTGHAESFEK